MLIMKFATFLRFKYYIFILRIKYPIKFNFITWKLAWIFCLGKEIKMFYGNYLYKNNYKTIENISCNMKTINWEGWVGSWGVELQTKQINSHLMFVFVQFSKQTKKLIVGGMQLKRY